MTDFLRRDRRLRRLRVQTFMPSRDRRRAGRHRLRRILDLDEAHAAVRRDGLSFFVVTESRDINVGDLVGHLDEHLPLAGPRARRR